MKTNVPITEKPAIAISGGYDQCFDTDLQEIEFKILFSVPDGFSCFSEKSQDKFIAEIEKKYNVRESGIGFGCFGIKIGVALPELIYVQKNEIELIAAEMLKPEKIKQTKPRGKDIYSTIFQLAEGNRFGMDVAELKQVVYTDNRLFQGAYFSQKCWEMRGVIKRVEKIPELMEIIHDMVLPGFFGHSIYITFKKGLTFTESEFIDISRKILIESKPDVEFHGDF